MLHFDRHNLSCEACFTHMKNRSGSYKDKAGNKIVKHFSDSSLGEKCYVSILQTHLRKLPPKVKEKESADFYWKLKDKTPLDKDACWFTLQACGRNILGSVVKSVREQAVIHGKTNHSLHAIGATRLFAAENLIAERTGHCSTEALHMYERTSVEQQQTFSSIIVSSVPNVTSTSAEIQGQVIERCAKCEDARKATFDNCQNCTINVNISICGGAGGSCDF